MNSNVRPHRGRTHSLRDLLAQRIYGLCCGYEDLNDHDTLRDDLLMQTAVGRVDALASSPTLCCLEARATDAQAVALHGVLIDQFIASHKTAPKELVLDFDASDVPLHGNQERSEFHAYCDHHCYLPLYVFCGQAMLACVLRRIRIDGAKNATAVLKLLVQRLGQAWPEVRIQSCAATQDSVVSGCCAAASVGACTASSAWRATRGWKPRCNTPRRCWLTSTRARDSSSV